MVNKTSASNGKPNTSEAENLLLYEIMFVKVWNIMAFYAESEAILNFWTLKFSLNFYAIRLVLIATKVLIKVKIVVSIFCVISLISLD